MNNLNKLIKDYKNSEKHNDFLYDQLSQFVNNNSFLKIHRDYIESRKLGFGDRAFHGMWYLILKDLLETQKKPKVLEIGVYKGQVISLWAYIANKFNYDIDIYAISPFKGNLSKNILFNNRYINKVRRRFSKDFRYNSRVGNHHLKEDYLNINRKLFANFKLDFEKVNKIIGFSNDDKILKSLQCQRFDLVYIDGDHKYSSVMSDIMNYSVLIKPGGYLIMDDASYFLPGSIFHKGIEEVSKACEIIENYGFNNVLNVGHNRVYKKV